MKDAEKVEFDSAGDAVGYISLDQAQASTDHDTFMLMLRRSVVQFCSTPLVHFPTALDTTSYGT
ncbi:MAG: hypothetical protein QF467_07565 [SAR202 cluster bacterium]|nr:hypothetical protein [SAR202 cluster bacterium]